MCRLGVRRPWFCCPHELDAFLWLPSLENKFCAQRIPGTGSPTKDPKAASDIRGKPTLEARGIKFVRCIEEMT